mmetsp:Transcript_642/g.1155  ORF Transcript_642/g.1155 Transcript_642/m.1155 type:complete len:285 (-) Transcript_642:87-941(-)
MAGRSIEVNSTEEAEQLRAKALAYDQFPKKPQWIYCIQPRLYGHLFRTHLTTGFKAKISLHSLEFQTGSIWCELPYGKLCFTGGVRNGINQSRVVCIDTLKECASTTEPDMLTPRRLHAATYFDNCLYIIGGIDKVFLRDCERLEVSLAKWVFFEPLPQPCLASSVVALEETRCLYALGGVKEKYIDLIQRLSLGELRWDILELKLPRPCVSVAFFKLDESQVYFVMPVTNSLHSFKPKPESIKLVKTLSESLKYWRGLSYYSYGYLYTSASAGYPSKVSLCID